MVSFTSKTLILSGILSLASASNLRAGDAQSERQLQGICGILPFLPGCGGGDAQTQPQCPQVSPLSAAEFDVDSYIAKSWFIQKQQVNPYQNEDQLYCIVATYDSTATEFIQVSNYGNNNAVNGPPQNSDNNGAFSSLCAKQIDGGELAVAPCLFGGVFDYTAGPYWVLAVAPDYSWAIVSGGQPDQPRPGNTCTTKAGDSFLDTNGSGLWLFTREQVAPAATIEAMETKLTEMGVFAGDLKNVTQEGCLYQGASLKL